MTINLSLQELAADLGGTILGVDTSTPFCVATLVTESAVDERHDEGPSMPSERLAPLVDALFREYALAFSSLKAIVVGIGPGSFTGLRVGLSFVKGLALCDSIPIYTQSSLLMLAASHLTEEVSEIRVALDARRGDVFLGHYQTDINGLPKALRADGISSAEVLEKMNSEAWVLDAALHKKNASGILWQAPSVRAGIACAMKDIRAGRVPTELFPSYLRVSEAERQSGIVIAPH